MIIDTGSPLYRRLSNKKTDYAGGSVIIECSVNNTLYLSTSSTEEAFRFFNQRRGRGQNLQLAFRRLNQLQGA